MKKLLNKFIITVQNIPPLALLGFILILLYVWGRYLRIRLPRDIPFDFNLWWFILTIFICCSYVYIIYRILKPKNPPQIVVDYFNKISNIIKVFDDYLKTFSFVSESYKRIFTSLSNYIDYEAFSKWKIILIVIDIIPHAILLSTFSLDIFYFHQLYYFYKVLWINLLFLLVPFSLNSFIYIKELIILYWEKNSKYVGTPYIQGVLPPREDFWHPEYEEDDEEENNTPPAHMYIPFRTFIELYFKETYYSVTESFYFGAEKTKFDYIVFPTKEWYEYFFKKYNFTWHSSSDELENKIIDKDVNLIIRLTSIVESYRVIITHTNILYIQKLIRLIIYSLYLMCWSYLIYISFNIQNLLDLFVILEKVSIYVEEPFSQNTLSVELLIFNIFTKTPKQKEEYIEHLNQKELRDLNKKQSEQYYAILSPEQKRLLNIKETLEIQKKQYEDSRSKEERHEENMKNKKKNKKNDV